MKKTFSKNTLELATVAYYLGVGLYGNEWLVEGHSIIQKNQDDEKIGKDVFSDVQYDVHYYGEQNDNLEVGNKYAVILDNFHFNKIKTKPNTLISLAVFADRYSDVYTFLSAPKLPTHMLAKAINKNNKVKENVKRKIKVIEKDF